ncbi:hypothetical protein FRB98_003169 [Tulasnella sp. 332]|nr:hypothetical protein FRB98_003169 [Tulasnella sp. 332]
MTDELATRNVTDEDNGTHFHQALANANRTWEQYQDSHYYQDLLLCIAWYGNACRLCPELHPRRPAILNNLAIALLACYDRMGDLDDLGQSIARHRESLSLCQIGHPSRSSTLHNLGNALRKLFEASGDRANLGESIACHRECLELCPVGHPDRRLTLDSLGVALQILFEQTGKMGDLEESIEHHQEDLSLCPPDDPSRSQTLTNLGAALMLRFDQTGKLTDLNSSISYQQEALDQASDIRQDRSSTLNNLAIALMTRFEQEGDVEDLISCISHLRQVISLRGPDHPGRSAALCNLGIALQLRFDKSEDTGDLDACVAVLREALGLSPIGQPSRSLVLNNLAVSLRVRFEKRRSVADLDECIQHHREDLSLCPVGDPGRCLTLNNLGLAFRVRFEEKAELGDLNECVACLEEALLLCPAGHPSHPMALENLGIALRMRFENTRNRIDLNTSISHHEACLSLCPVGHPHRSLCLYNAGLAVMDRFEGDGEDGRKEADLETAYEYFREAAGHEFSPILVRLKASRHWITAARKHNSGVLDEAYRSALALLDRSVLLARNVGDRYLRVTTQDLDIGGKNLALDAASHSIEEGQLETAVQLLEQGRGVMFNQLGSYRTPLDDLEEIDRDLAGRFRTLSAAIERSALVDGAGADGQDTAEDVVARYYNTRPSPYQILTTYLLRVRYQGYTTEWNEVVEEIRRHEDFKDFLRTQSFSNLQNAARDGPVIIVNISQYRSDAIIVSKSGQPLCIPLPKATPSAVEALARTLIETTTDRPDADKSKQILGVLMRDIWGIIVEPIVLQLENTLKLRRGSRIWWVPTSSAWSLPLHASGPYAQGEKNLPDRFVSSYTPTLLALLRARARSRAISNHPGPRLLIVAQPEAEGEEELPNVLHEIALIQELASDVSVLSGENCTRDAVLADLKETSWVHFACHGNQHPTEPFKSHFSLKSRDAPLTLLDIIKSGLPQAELAVCSACHSAAGDKSTPDETIHLAAGIMFTGFRSVVGTMWAMADTDGPVIAEEFYKYMFRNGPAAANCKDAAMALSKAVRELRRRKVPLERWINFVHYGI